MRYSFSQRLQKSSAILLVLWCVFSRLPSFCASVVEGNVVSFAPQRKCSGVNTSSVSCVMGLEFRAASMLNRVVANSSSVAYDRLNTFFTASSCGANHTFPPSSPPSRPWCNELPGDASMCKVVGCPRVVEDGTYIGQFAAGCLEGGGVIRVDSVGETATADKSVQRHRKFINRHI